jgi:zinc transporter 1
MRLGSIGAIATGLIVMYVPYEWKHYADPLLSALLALIILKASVPIVVQSGKLLLQSVPKSIDLEKLSQQLLEIDGVDYVGSIHVWALSAEQYMSPASISTVSRRCRLVASRAKSRSCSRLFGVGNVTVEPHFVERALTRWTPRPSCTWPLPTAVSFDASELLSVLVSLRMWPLVPLT